MGEPTNSCELKATTERKWIVRREGKAFGGKVHKAAF